jgi:hypothetical protein
MPYNKRCCANAFFFVVPLLLKTCPVSVFWTVNLFPLRMIVYGILGK